MRAIDVLLSIPALIFFAFVGLTAFDASLIEIEDGFFISALIGAFAFIALCYIFFKFHLIFIVIIPIFIWSLLAFLATDSVSFGIYDLFGVDIFDSTTILFIGLPFCAIAVFARWLRGREDNAPEISAGPHPDPPRINENHAALTGVNAFIEDDLWPFLIERSQDYIGQNKISVKTPGYSKFFFLMIGLFILYGYLVIQSLLLEIPANLFLILLFGGFFAPLAIAFWVASARGWLRSRENEHAIEKQAVGRVLGFFGFSFAAEGDDADLTGTVDALRTLRVLPAMHTRTEDHVRSAEGAAHRLGMMDVLVSKDGDTDNHLAHYFRGLVISAKYPRPFTCTTVGHGARTGQAGIMTAVGGMASVGPKAMPDAFRRARMESEAFNNAFTVMAEDQVEARRLVTPAFMLRVMDVANIFHARHVDFAFHDGRMILAIDLRRDAFEFGDGFSLLDADAVELLVAEIAALVRLSEALRAEIDTA